MNPDNELPIELLPEGYMHMILAHFPDEPENERWLVDLFLGENSAVYSAHGATPRAALLAAVRMIEDGKVFQRSGSPMSSA